MTCELCDNAAFKRDADMGFMLCRECYGAFNGEIIDIELNEVWID